MPAAQNKCRTGGWAAGWAKRGSCCPHSRWGYLASRRTFLCEAQLVGADKAREQFLQVRRRNDSHPHVSSLCKREGQGLLGLDPASHLVCCLCTVQVGRDPRPVMRAAYECFRTGSSPDNILAAAVADLDKGGHDAFYAQLVRGSTA